MSSSAHEVTLSKIYFNRALVKVHLGDDDAALDDLELALKHSPRDKAARGARAVILRRMGNWHDSQREYMKLDQQRQAEKLKKQANSLKQAQRGAKANEATKAVAGSMTPKVGRLTIKNVHGREIVVPRVAQSTGGAGVRPSTAPVSGRKRKVKSINVADTDKQKTPFEIEEDKKDGLKKIREKLKKNLEEEQKAERQIRREARPAIMGGAGEKKLCQQE